MKTKILLICGCLCGGNIVVTSKDKNFNNPYCKECGIKYESKIILQKRKAIQKAYKDDDYSWTK